MSSRSATLELLAFPRAVAAILGSVPWLEPLREALGDALERYRE